jgi:hypothetical protein
MNEQQHVASGSIIRGPRPDSSKQTDVVYAVEGADASASGGLE